MTSDELWALIVAHQGETFRQMRGGESDIHRELPLKRVWALVPEEVE